VAAEDLERDLQAAGDLDLVDAAADLVAADDLLDGAGDLELALLDDGDGVAEAVELAQDVAADHDADALAGDLAQDLAQLAAGERVEAVGGLVEQQQLGAVDQGAGDREALAHALAHLGDAGLGLAAEVEDLQELGDAGAGGLVGLAVALGEELQVAGGGHAGVEGGAVAEEADALADLVAGGPGVAAVPQHAALVGALQGGEDPQGGALAGAVGADQGEHLAALDRQVEALHRVAHAVVRVVDVVALDLLHALRCLRVARTPGRG
jgi:hypothetical protein